MSESINIENKKQDSQKPPLSIVRITCEFLAGLALGLVALLVVYIAGIVLVGKGEYAVFGFLSIFFIFFPPLYVLGSAVGVYLLGVRGNQRGSFRVTLGFGFLGGLFMTVVLFLFLIVLTQAERFLLAPVLLFSPILATYGFNLRRRYKEPPAY